MWLMLPKGALSITVSPKEPDKLQLRARRVEWLDAFREYCPELGPNIHTTNADYQWRALAKPEDVARGVAKATMAIDYSNFKNATASPKHGLADSKLRHGLHEAYSKVWSIMLNAGDKTSAMNAPSGSGTIAVCARLGHWWPEGREKCSDCGKLNPSYPDEGPKNDKPSQAEVRAWWAARQAKARQPKKASKAPVQAPAQKEPWGESGSFFNTCPGSGQAAASGTFSVKNGVARGTCFVCGEDVTYEGGSLRIHVKPASGLQDVV